MVEGPKYLKRKDNHLDVVTEVTYLRMGQRVVVWEAFPSDGQKQMWMRKGDIGTVQSVDSDSDATISFQGRGSGGSSLPTIVKKKNWNMLRVEAAPGATGIRLKAPGEESAPKKRMVELPSVFSSASAAASKPADGAAAAEKKAAKPAQEEKPMTEEELAKAEAAAAWLKRDPKKGVVRYTFKQDCPLGLRFSQDVPPWILGVNDGSQAARKAPRVPIGGVVIAVNGYELTQKNCQEAMQGLKKRPVFLDVDWPIDQSLPVVNRA